MEMIERVARAICLARGGLDPDAKQIGSKALVWEAFSDQARAAIEAMREPTDAMKAAASEPKNSDWDEIWHPMIDAALNPDSTSED